MLRAIDELGMGGIGTRNLDGIDDGRDLVSAVRALFDEIPEPHVEAVARFSRRYPVVSRGVLTNKRLDLVREALRVADRGGTVVSHMIFGLSLMMMCNRAGLTADSAQPLPQYAEPQGIMQFPPSMVALMAAPNMIGPAAAIGIPVSLFHS